MIPHTELGTKNCGFNSWNMVIKMLINPRTYNGPRNAGVQVSPPLQFVNPTTDTSLKLQALPQADFKISIWMSEILDTLGHLLEAQIGPLSTPIPHTSGTSNIHLSSYPDVLSQRLNIWIRLSDDLEPIRLSSESRRLWVKWQILLTHFYVWDLAGIDGSNAWIDETFTGCRNM
jgi:hypothetical protein